MNYSDHAEYNGRENRFKAEAPDDTNALSQKANERSKEIVKPYVLMVIALAVVFYVATEMLPDEHQSASAANAYQNKRAQRPVADPSEDAAVEPEPPPVDTTVYTPEFVNSAFRDNEVSAEARFKGRAFIGGVATNIETDLVSGARLDLIGVSGESVLCDFEEGQVASLQALHRGSVVALSCERARRIMGNVIFSSCAVAKIVQ